MTSLEGAGYWLDLGRGEGLLGRRPQQIAGELPELVARHNARLEAREQLEQLLKQLRAEREKRGLDLTDLTRLTGLKPSAVATLEADSSPNPTIETLARYAEVVGKRLTVSLTDVI